MSAPLILFGLGSFVDFVAHHFETQGGRRVVAQTAHRRFIPAGWSGPRPMLPFEEVAAHLPPGKHDIFIALEHGEQNAARAAIAREAKSMGYALASFISPAARIAAGAEPGEHSFVLDGVCIQHGARIGANNIIHANAYFGQGCSVGDDNYFGAGFFADRHCRIGTHNVFGSQVRIGEAIDAGSWNFIHAFQTIDAPLARPTLIDAGLRMPGHIVDRRRTL
jgi:hypothetical protein